MTITEAIDLALSLSETDEVGIAWLHSLVTTDEDAVYMLLSVLKTDDEADIWLHTRQRSLDGCHRKAVKRR